MTTSRKLQNAITRELQCRGGLVSIPSLVEDYGPQVKSLLWEMRGAGLVRLVAIGDYSTFTAEEMETGCVHGDREVFGYAELA